MTAAGGEHERKQMNGSKGIMIELTRVLFCIAIMLGYSHAQVSTTTIVDTVYRADGTAAGGSLLISWPEFTTSASQIVPAGKTVISIAANGSVNFPLAPNAGAMPAGTYYTAVYHLSDGTVSTEYWTVPVAQQIGIAAIRSNIVPATIAVQSASINYVNSAITSAVTGYLPLTGGTLTGPLYLSEDPVQSTEAATKHYVDSGAAGINAGLASKVALNPAAAQTITQPPGTTLEVNDLESLLYASADQTGAGNNGIANSMAQTNCQSGGCLTIADPGYSTVEEPQGHPFPACFNSEPGSGDGDLCGYPWPINSRIWDQRGGTDIFGYQNPVNRFGGVGTTHPMNYPGTASSDAATAVMRIGDYDADYGNGQVVAFEDLLHQFAGGHNGNYGSGFNKTNVYVGEDKAVDFSQGQHQIRPQVEFCLGLGDCLGSPLHMFFASGLSAPSDEGIHRGDNWINEDTRVYQGTCSSGCSSGSTLVTTTPTSGEGDQGEGRMAIDITQASGGNLGQVTLGVGSGQIIGQIGSSGNTPVQFVAPAGTFNPSTAMGTTTTAIVAATNQGTPGVQTVSITSASGSLVPGIACITDVNSFEMVNVTASASTSLTASFRKPHPSGTVFAQGGTCGYGIALNADTVVPNGATVRVLIPMLGSPDSAHSYVNTFNGGVYFGEGSAWNYNTLSGLTATYSSSTGLVTITGNFGFTEDTPPQGPGTFGNLYGQSLTISGASDQHYNGTYPVTIVGTGTFTYAPSVAPSSSSVTGVTVTACNCSFTMYPRAEVLGVYNSTTKQVDGTLTLEPNNVAWASGDTVEVPHWHQPAVNDTHDAISMFTPQAQTYGRGYNYHGTVTGDLHGFDLRNDGVLNEYLGFGGWHTPPNTAQYIEGWWNRSFSINTAPNEAVLEVGCKPSTPGNSDGCTKFDAAYSIGEFFNAAGGFSRLNFDPNANNFSFVNSNPCSTVIGSSVGTSSGTTVGGLAVTGPSANCDLVTMGLVLNNGTAITGQTGTGSLVVTNTGPAISSPTLTSAILNSSSVPSGQTFTVAGTLAATHIIGNGSTPTAAVGAGAGTGGAVAVSNGTDLKGTITVTTGTSPSSGGVIATITFATGYSSAPVCTVTPASASAVGTFYSAPASVSSLTLNAGAAALASSTTYIYSYLCM
jgi:hypothetical protein